MLLLIVIFQTMCSFADAAGSVEKVGFGVTNSFLSDVAVEAFTSGFLLGTSRASELKSKIVIDTDLSHSPLAAVSAVRRLNNKGAEIFVGFPGSHDCLLAAHEIDQLHSPALFLNCAHNDLNSYSGKMATTESDMNEEVSEMLNFLSLREKSHHGVVIINTQHISSKLQGDLYAQKLNDSNPSLSIVNLNRNGELPTDIVSQIRTKQIEFMILTAYPDLLQALREQLSREKISTRLYGSSAWDNLAVARRFLVNLKANFIYPTSWDRATPESTKFISAFKSAYGTEPSPEAAYGYDLGTILAKLSNESYPKSLRVALARAIKEKQCFSGLLAGKLCLGDRGAHSHRTRIFVEVTPKGLVRVQ